MRPLLLAALTSLSVSFPLSVQAADWCPVGPAAKETPAAVELLNHAHRHLSAVPHAMAHLHTQGSLPHQGNHDASAVAERDFPIMRDAALAWRLTGERQYADQVEAFLSAWSQIYVPSFDPIDETKLEGMIEAYAWTRDALSPVTAENMRRLLRAFAEGYIARTAARSDPSHGLQSNTWVNNWQSHRVKLVALSAAALDDAALMQQAQAMFLQQLANNVRADGSVEDFEERDALHYVVFDLEPLTMAALAARPFGIDLLHAKASNGATLVSAIDWLIPYAKGSREHEEYVHTRVNFDHVRAKAGLAGFSGLWKRGGAATLFWQATLLDGRYRNLALELTGRAPQWLELCETNAHEASR